MTSSMVDKEVFVISKMLNLEFCASFKMKPLDYLYLCSFLGGFIMFLGNVIAYPEYNKLHEEGIETDAIVTAKTLRKSGKGGIVHSYSLFVEYQDFNQQNYKEKIAASKSVYDAIDDNPVIKIKYLPDSPKNVQSSTRIEKFQKNFYSQLVLWGGAGIIGGYLFIKSVRATLSEN